MRAAARLLVALPLAVALALPGCVVLLPVDTAQAAACPPSGGATIAPAKAAGDVVFHGGGWGHGLGMSQYGAQGAARLGCSAEQILGRYYPGTQVQSRAMPGSVRLRLLDDGYRVDVEAVQGALTWVQPGCVLPTPSVTGPPCPPAQPQGARWQLRLDDATHSHFVLYDLAVTPRRLLWSGGSVTEPLRLQQSGAVAHLTTWRGASIYLERWVRWDWTRFSVDGTLLDAVQQIDTTEHGSAMDKYLWGIAEVPASFPPAALQAQAIAARTYAAKRDGRILMPTPADQNWTGWKKETEGTGGGWGQTWRAAVDATSGQVVAAADTGALIDAFYSSSMGGHTEDERYVWGVEAPFLRAVDDSAWDAASSNPAGKRSWAVGVSWSTLAAKLGFSSISTISVPPRGDVTRTAGVKVVGVRSGRLTTSYVEGWDVREALGLLSPGFTITVRRTGGAAAQPLVGDWDGDGHDQLGWYKNGQVALLMTGAGAGTWVKRFRYGGPGDVAVVGDWDHDGDDDLGVYRAGSWLLRSGLTGGSPTRTLHFGRAGDTPVVGSWTAKKLGVAVVRGRTWLLRRGLTSGQAQKRFRYGKVGDTPVAGSWSGGPRTGIGVERDGRWLLRNRRSAGPASVTVAYGLAADRAVVGDWDGTGTSTPAVVRGRQFVLRATLAPEAATRTTTFRG